MLNIIKNNRGSTVVIFAITLSIVLMFISLVVDIGMLIYSKSKLQNAVDAASLAAAQEIPKDTCSAKCTAEQYLAINGFEIEELTYSIDFEDSNTKVVISASHNVNLFFAPFIGINSSNVSAKAMATNAPAKQVVKDLRPFAIEWDPLKDKGKFKPGEAYTFKYSFNVTKNELAEMGPGNFGPVKLNKRDNGTFETGANVYKNTIVNGSKTMLKVGDTIYTETGNMVGPTVSGMDDLFELKGSPATIYIPLVDNFNVNGSSPVTITGFAAFEISQASYSSEQEGKGKNKDTIEKANIKGHFTEFTTIGIGDINVEDHGLRVVNLVE